VAPLRVNVLEGVRLALGERAGFRVTMRMRLFQAGCIAIAFSGCVAIDWMVNGYSWLAFIWSAIVTTGVQKCMGTL